MSDLSVFKAPVCENAVSTLKEALRRAEAGEIRNVALISDTSDGQFYTTFGYDDVSILLGRLEFAKLAVYRGRINNE